MSHLVYDPLASEKDDVDEIELVFASDLRPLEDDQAMPPNLPPVVEIHQLLQVATGPTHPVGTRLAVYWADEKKFYKGEVIENDGNFVQIRYDDDEVHWERLSDMPHRVLLTNGVTKCTTCKAKYRRFVRDDLEEEELSRDTLQSSLFSLFDSPSSKGTDVARASSGKRRKTNPTPQKAGTIEDEDTEAVKAMLRQGYLRSSGHVRKLPNGLYATPCGRPRQGYDFDHLYGLWKPQVCVQPSIPDFYPPETVSSTHHGNHMRFDNAAAAPVSETVIATAAAGVLKNNCELSTPNGTKAIRASQFSLADEFALDFVSSEAAVGASESLARMRVWKLCHELERELSRPTISAARRCIAVLEQLGRLNLDGSTLCETNIGTLVQRVLKAHPSAAETAESLLEDWKDVYVQHKLLQKLQRIVEEWEMALALSVPQGQATVNKCIREFLLELVLNFGGKLNSHVTDRLPLVSLIPRSSIFVTDSAASYAGFQKLRDLVRASTLSIS